MNDYIKREDAITELIEGFKSFVNEHIDECPAADVVERKKGRWLNIEQPGVRIKGAKYCSVCKKRTYSESELYDFCPHCGSYNGGENEI